jgi:transcriptional regulator with XRE-family HTH domain
MMIVRKNNPNHRIPWNLRRLRVARGLSQEQLAVDANVDRSYVSRLERGLENPTLALLDRLAGALDVSAADLLAPAHGAKPKPLPGGRKPSGRKPRRR